MNMRQRHSIDLLFSLSLFMVFVICSFLVLLLQTNGYHQIIESGKKAESIHTPLAYVQTQLRVSDERDAIDVFESGSIQGIQIKETVSKSTLYIYEDHHKLKELRILDTVEPDFTTGTTLFDIREFKVVKNEKKIILSMRDKHQQEQTLTIALHCD